MLLQDSEATLSTLYQLRALGVRIAMDDFGTGYSSLSYLQSFPFDKIKIDRSFVKDIADGVGSLNIVRAVAAMANGLGMATTAEGVETKEQLETVRAEGCTEMQGFLFSRPLPGERDRAAAAGEAQRRADDSEQAARLRRLIRSARALARSSGNVRRVSRRRRSWARRSAGRPGRPTGPGCARPRCRRPPCCGRCATTTPWPSPRQAA